MIFLFDLLPAGPAEAMYWLSFALPGLIGSGIESFASIDSSRAGSGGGVVSPFLTVQQTQ